MQIKHLYHHSYSGICISTLPVHCSSLVHRLKLQNHSLVVLFLSAIYLLTLLLLNLPLFQTMFYYSGICNYTYNRRLRHSTQAEAKVIPLLHCQCVPSRPAVKPWDWRVMSFILSSSVFHSLTPLIVLLPRTWSVYSQYIHSNSQYIPNLPILLSLPF